MSKTPTTVGTITPATPASRIVTVHPPSGKTKQSYIRFRVCQLLHNADGVPYYQPIPDATFLDVQTADDYARGRATTGSSPNIAQLLDK